MTHNFFSVKLRNIEKKMLQMDENKLSKEIRQMTNDIGYNKQYRQLCINMTFTEIYTPLYNH